MPEPSQTIYWDSCVFISYLKETAGRIEIIAALLEKAQRGEIEIVTSTCTIVEVAFIASEQSGHQSRKRRGVSHVRTQMGEVSVAHIHSEDLRTLRSWRHPAPASLNEL